MARVTIMLNRIKHRLAPPIFEDDEEKTRVARLLSAILWAMLIVVVILASINAALVPPPDQMLRLMIGAVTVAIILGLLFITHRGQIKLASVLAPSASLILVTATVFTLGGLRSPVTSGYLIVIVIASLLLGGRGSLVFALLSSLAALGMLSAESRGLVHPAQSTSGLRAWIVYTGFFGLAALLLRLAAQSIRDGLENARRLHAVEQERARELAALLAAERKRAQQLKLLARVAHQLVGFDDPQALMDEAVRRLHEDFGFEHIALLLAEGGELVMRAQHGTFAHLAPLLQRIPLGQGIVGWAAETGLTYLANDVAADEHFHPLPEANTASELAAPLRLGPDVIGVLNVESEQIGAFDTTDVSTLESLADLLAAGLRSSRLSAELRARERMAEALQRVSVATTSSLDLPTVLDTVCAEACAAFAADRVVVWLLAEDAETLEAVAAYGLSAETVLGQRRPLTDSASIAARAVRERRPIFVNDLPHASEGETQLKSATGAQAVLVTPILKDMQPLGAITILDAYHPQRFQAEDVAAAELLGAQLAVAIHNARLFEAERRRAAQLSLLEEVSRQITGTLDEGEIFQRAVTGIVNRFGFAQAGIVVPVGDDELELIAVAGSLDIGPQPGFRQKIGQGIIGQVATSRAAYVTGDISHDPYYFNPIGDRAGSALGVPLQREDQLLGVVYVESIARNTFDADDVRTLETLANHIATALQNARLYARARDRLREMTALQSGAQTVASSLELHQIFQAVVQLLQDTFGYRYVSLYQLDGEVLRLGAQVGYPAALIISEVPVTLGISGRAVRTQQTQFIQDVRAEPDFLRATYEVQSEICVPLLKDRTVLGTLNVESGPDQPLAEADVDILTVFASQVTVAIENARLFEAERAQHELAEALRATGAVLSASLDFETVLDRLLDQITRVVRYDTANIMLVESEGGRTRMARTRGYEQFGAEVAEDTANLTFEIAVTPNLRRMAETGQPLIIPDTAADPGWVRVKAAAHIRSWAGAPILAQGHVIAFFSVGKMEPNVYRPADAERLAAFSGQAALALQNARLFEAEQRRAEGQRLLFAAARDFTSGLSEDAVLKAIVRHMVSVLAIAGCTISLWESAQDRLVTLLDYDAEDETLIDRPGTAYRVADYPATRRVLESLTTLVVSLDDPGADPAESALLRQFGYDTMLMLPLVVGERALGLIELSRRAGAPPFSEADRQMAQSLAAQAAVALENARLHTTVTERARELDALLTANAAMLSTLDLDLLLDNILQAALAAIPAAEKGAILLQDPATGQLQIRAISGYTDARVQNFSFAGSEGYSAQAAREQRALLIPDVRADPAIRYDGDIPEVRAIYSAIAVPLILHDQPLGVISLDATRRAAFTEADLRLLIAFANAAAVAIDNAQLHAEVRALAVTDGLTGLANHRAFDQALEAEVARAGRYGYPLALVFLDIDSFKLYNDTYGHPAGNERLKAIAALLHDRVREPDLAARYGGEEFALILPHTHKDGALILAERIRVAAEAAAPNGGASGMPVSGYTLSLGVAVFPGDALTPDDLLVAADNAEIAAKRAGKNRVVAAPALAAR